VTTRYLICGRREDADEALVQTALSAIILHPQDAVVIHGNARARKGHGESYDRLAGKWAQAHGAQVITETADWDLHGRAAGPIRNATMLKKHDPDVVVAFPGGRGTRDMIARARRAKVVVIEVTE